jgi:membrane fusion protein, macrolide-specific efflux system
VASVPWRLDLREQDTLALPVQLGMIGDAVLATNTREPARMVKLGAQVNGQIKAAHVFAGGEVKAGQSIAKIDAVSLTNALHVAEAALANVSAQRRAREVRRAFGSQ